MKLSLPIRAFIVGFALCTAPFFTAAAQDAAEGTDAQLPAAPESEAPASEPEASPPEAEAPETAEGSALPETEEAEALEAGAEEAESSDAEPAEEALTGGAWFLDRFSWAFGGSIRIFPEDNGMRGDPMPVLPVPSLSAAFRIWGPIHTELSLDVYYTHYGYDFELGRAVPYAIENRSAQVWGFLTGIGVQGRFGLPKGFVLRGTGGIAMDLRIIAIAGDLNDVDFTGDEKDPGVQTDAIKDYFWGEGRWLFPFLGVGFDFPASSKFLVGLDGRVWFPLYRALTGEDLPPMEGWRFGFGIRITLP
ncbi:MAG: hypothetical protein LBR96_06020 [Treponema sp.]|jgi:hypothetical protein|nr:hypothetical protein [Treponema sp.]